MEQGRVLIQTGAMGTSRKGCGPHDRFLALLAGP